MAATIGTLAVRIAAKTATFNRDVKGAAKSLGSISTAAAKVSKASAAAFAGLTTTLGLVTRSFAGFETSLVRVGAVAGASSSQMQELEASARGLAKATTFSAKEVADGMGFMAMAGFEVNEIVGSMPSVLQLAAAGMVDLSTAADITTNILTGMGLEVSELGEVNDILVAAMTGSNVTLETLGEAFGAVGPVAKSAGIGITEIAAAVGLLGNVNIKGEKAGTALRNAIVRLVKQTPEASAALRKLGIEALDGAGKLKPLTTIVGDLEGAGADLTDMIAIFGLKAGPAMSALVGQGSEALKTFKQRLDDSGGAAAKLERAALGTLTARFKILVSNLEELAIVIGKRVAPTIKALFDGLTGVVAKIASLPAGILNAITKFAIWGTAITGIVAGLAGISAVMIPIAAAALPVVAAVALIGLGILLAITAIGTLKKAWDEDLLGMKTTVVTFAEDVGKIWSGLVSFLSEELFGFFGDLDETLILIIAKLKGLSAEEAGAIVIQARKAKAEGEGGLFAAPEGSLTAEFIAAGKKVGSSVINSAKAFGGFVVDGFAEGVDLIRGVLPDLSLAMMPAGAGAGGGGLPAPSQIGTIDSRLAGPAGPTGGGVSLKISDATNKSIEDDIRREVGSSVGKAALVFGSAITGAAGEAGTLINSAMAGFAQGGGPFGAIAAVVAELITRTKSFKETVNDANETVSELSEAFEPLAANVKPLAVLTNRLVGVIGEQLKPVFEALTPVFEGLFTVMKFVAVTILRVVRSIGEVWNGLISATAQVLRDTLGKKIGGKIAEAFEKFEINLSGINKQIKNLDDLTLEQARAAGVEAEATEGVTDAMRELRESMSNIPTGFRINLRRFQSSEGETGAPDQGSAGGGGNTFIFNVNDFEETARKLDEIESFTRFTNGEPLPKRAPFSSERNGG